jgi:hypothetical protein
VQNK